MRRMREEDERTRAPRPKAPARSDVARKVARGSARPGEDAALAGDRPAPGRARAGQTAARGGGASGSKGSPAGGGRPGGQRRSPRATKRPRAVRPAERARALEVIERLDRAMPNAAIELHYESELELLVAVMLSAQCTDAMVNRCTPSLFAAFPTAAAYAAARPEDLHPHISRCGLYRNKAKNIVAAMQRIEAEHGGALPRTREALEELPGVGHKTAGVVAVHAFGGQAFPVDTHVGRLARRLGFTCHEDPDKVEADMQRTLPPETWAQGHQLLVWHGRRCCRARKPACSLCPVADLCPRRGVTSAG